MKYLKIRKDGREVFQRLSWFKANEKTIYTVLCVIALIVIGILNYIIWSA